MTTAGRLTSICVLLVCACTSDPPLQPVGGGADGGFGAGTGPTATASYSSTGSGDSSSSTGFYSDCGDEAGTPPLSVPPDWVPWTCKPGCTYWLPPNADAMPSPMEWQPCPAIATYAGCQQLLRPWSDGVDSALVADLGFATDALGVSRLLLGRQAINGDGDAQSYKEWVFGDVDGAPLDVAIRQRWGSDCNFYLRNASADLFALTVYNTDYDNDGLLVAQVGSVPELLYDDPAPGSSTWYAGSEWLVRQDAQQLTLMKHDLSAAAPLYDPGRSIDATPFTGHPLFVGRDILFTAGDVTASGVWAYDDERGTHPLVWYPNDPERGAGNIGTDGVDLVWSYGEGKEDLTTGLYTEVSIMTAPYTTDPDAIEPRRLRADLNSELAGNFLSQFRVGCGHAARTMNFAHDIEVVRLSDGAGWVMQGNDDWRWQGVLGVTCDDVFADVVGPTGHTIARVPLASLGEPLPPD